ncbi:Rib/alpha-like domain-containing protein, partial [Gemella sp.]
MLFNRHGLQQKNWRMVKKGKHILFGCSLFFVVGGMSISGSQVVHASETNASRVVEEKVVANNTSSEVSGGKALTIKKEQVPKNIDDKKVEKTKQTQDVEKPAEKKEQKENLTSESGEKALVKKEVNKKELKDLVDKIKKTDISKKTEKSVKELNLVLSRAEKALDNKEVTQEEIDKEVKALKEVFDKLEDKPKEEKKSEVTEKEESKKDDKVSSEKDTKEKQQENTTEDVARRYNEKITKATNIAKEINSLASEINYDFSDSEKELVNNIEKLPTTDNNSEESIQKLLNEAIYLRNRVANRVTRANSGRRDPRNGKLITGRDESGFRAISIVPVANKYDGQSTLTSEQKTELTYYNSDEVFSFFDINGKRGPGEKVYKITHGENTGKEDVTPYYVQRIGIVRGLENFPGLKLKLAYKGAPGKAVDIESGYWNVNNPAVGTAIFGVIGSSKPVAPGTYEIVIGANGKRPEIGNRNVATITYRYTIKPQSERNTVRDLTPTYVDDVRHLTETEKNALIEKFKAEHPNVVNRTNHVDFDRAEVSADGTTMTIHFKDGFAPKTIQTNAQNDVEAKHQSITAYFGDSKELYTNPRQLVRSKTGHEVPTTATVTYKTPFNLQQAGTRNVVVTTTYENGVTKDIITPYTVLDFIGKQDKKINQNQSGELGDARNYVTVSNNSAVPSELTVRWKGGSTVDTSAAGVQYKEIEILRGNHLMKTVTIPVEIVDNINPTITAPDNITLTRLEGLPSEINIHAQDNDKGVGLKESNSVTVENLPNPLFYNPRTSKIEINRVIPNNFQLGKSTIQVTVKAVDKKGNTATKNITFNIQSQTQKYTAVANSQIQEVSYGEAPDAGTSIQKNGLPTGTRYGWATQPNTTRGPGDQTEVVTVTYPDGSTDTVNVTVKVRKLSDEHIPTGKTITVNQNDSVTNDRLKAAVTVNNGGTSKVKSVTPVGTISTTNAGTSTIKATVTYLDDTTDPVDIPLEVKDVTAPTIQTPTDRQNWDLIALDRTSPPIKVTSDDNAGGTGIKSTTVTGLPDFLVYDNTTKTIKFKNGVQEVTKLPAGQDSKIYNVNIQVTDNSNNSSQRQVTITVKSMTTKYTATANSQKQTVSYGQTPNAETSINKNGLPARTSYTWRTIPNTTTGPGQKAGVVIVTYPDGSTDLVDVNVDVRKLSEEHEPTATKIVKNQNDSVSNADLKAAVTISNNGASKVKSVTPVGTINTVEAGEKEITATVTYLDDTTDTVKILLEVKDVTPPTIQTPSNGQNWDLIAVEGENPNITVTSEDNAGGSGVKSTTVTGLPDFLEYNESTKKIQFKTGVTQVPSLQVGTDVQPHNVTITVVDNAGNETTTNVTITVKSMTTKYDATSNTQKQTISYGETPDAGTSVNKTGLPEGTSYAWKTTPVTTDGPGEKDGVVEVTYKDGSKDMVNVKVTVKELSSEYEVTGNEIVVNQNDRVSNDDLKAKVTARSKVGNVDGTEKISKVEAKSELSTANYGDQNITATVTFKDGTTKEVTIPLKVKDVTKPTIQTPADNTNWEMTALDKALPNMEVRAEDNANGSGMKNVTVAGLPDYLEYDSATYTIKFKSGKDTVEKLPENTPSQEFTLNIRAEDNAGNVSERTAKITVFSMSAKKDPTPIPQNTSYGKVPDPNASVDKEGLPEGTNVTWKTPPVVNTPGTTTGEVEITYPDGSKDVVTVNVTVRKVSEDFTATGTQIEVNQKAEVTSEMLKAAVTAVNAQGENGNAKIATVEAKTLINTVAYGDQTIQAKVTYIDGSEQEVTIPLKVKDVTAPTIQTPTNGQNWDLIAVEGENPNITVTSEDNAGGSGVKSTTVTGLPDFLEYNESTKKIQFKTGVTQVPSLLVGTDVQPHNVTITVVDNAGNETTTNVTITVKSMTTKYEATPNSEKQTVSYGVTPDAGTSINKNGLPEGTNYTWTTTPETNTPGEKDGVVEVTYKDGSKDTVNVKVTVKELSSEYRVTGAPIEVNQNIPVTNDDLKAKVTATSTVGNINGTDKISTVTASPIDTSAYGDQTINATVTFKDGTTKEVTITLKVKDVTPPTITAPEENKNWEMTALDKTLPNMEVSAEDNANGSGIKTVSVEGLPDYLEYDSTTNSIKFKTGKQEVEILPENTPSKEFNLNIRVEDKAGNVSERAAKITVSSMSAKTTPQPIDQMVNYGQVPNPEDSVNKQGLPDGTTVTWKTPPVVNTPGSTTGEVEITYPDGSKDVVTVNVTVRKVSEEYTATGTQIEVNQNEEVTSDMLKGAVNATNAQGENGNAKIAKVESTAPISTTTYGDQTIQAKVTYIDGSQQDVTIRLKVKDVTDPTILTPEENKNWEMTALDKTLPVMKIKAEDNTNGSGIATIEVRNMPSFLTFDESTGTITFKEGVQEVPRIKSDNTMHGVTIIARDKAGNSTSILVNITVRSMRGKYDPQPKPQTVDNGTVPNAEDSVDKTGLPSGTTIAWKETPVVNTPGSHPTVALVTYPDGTVDEVTVPITVKKQSDTYTPTAIAQEVDNGHVPDPEASVNKTGLPEGTTVTWKTNPDVSTPGSHPTVALVHYPDGTVDEVTVPITVKKQSDTFNPTAKQPGQTAKHGSEPSAEGSINTEGLPSGTTYTWVEKPDTNTTPGSKPGKVLITYPDNSTEEVTVTVEVTPQKDDYDPQPKPQTLDNGTVPNAEDSVDKTGLPSGTTIAWKETPVVNTPGSHPTVALVTYPDGTVDEVTVPITVKKQSDTFNPTAKQPGQTAKHGSEPSAEGSINTEGLPSGTTYTWVEKPDTNTTPGSKPGKV